MDRTRQPGDTPSGSAKWFTRGGDNRQNGACAGCQGSCRAGTLGGQVTRGRPTGNPPPAAGGSDQGGHVVLARGVVASAEPNTSVFSIRMPSAVAGPSKRKPGFPPTAVSPA